MTPLVRRLALLGAFSVACLLSAGSQAQIGIDQTFPQPGNYCFDQTEWRGGLKQATFIHSLIISPQDQQKPGYVFVGFRLRSRPEQLWLAAYGEGWSLYDSSKDPVGYTGGGWLSAAVIQLPIIQEPIDLTAFAGDGELLVGYGLRHNSAETTKDVFQEMVGNQRYSVVWAIGSESPTGLRVCLHATGMWVG